jgi:hypothetical protein
MSTWDRSKSGFDPDTEANSDGVGDKSWGHNAESNVGVDAVSARSDVLSGSEHRADEIPEVPSVSASMTEPNRLGDATVTPELIDRLRSESEQLIVAAPHCCRDRRF